MGLVPLGAAAGRHRDGRRSGRPSHGAPPPSREAAVAAGRAHAVHSAAAAILLGLLAAGVRRRDAAGQRLAGRAGHHRAARTDHLRGRAHPRPGRRRADLAAAGRARCGGRAWCTAGSSTPPRAGSCGWPPSTAALAAVTLAGGALLADADGRSCQPRRSVSRPERPGHRQPLPRPLLRPSPAGARPARPGRSPPRSRVWIVATPAGRGHRRRRHRDRAAPGLGPPGAPGGGGRPALRHRRAARSSAGRALHSVASSGAASGLLDAAGAGRHP